MKINKRFIAFILVLLLCLSSILPVNSVSKDVVLRKSYEISDYFATLEASVANSICGEWMVLGLARGEKISNNFANEYYNKAVNFIAENNSPKIHRSKSTENSRMIIALTSIGKDVTNIAGYNLLDPLVDFAYVKKQGINGPVWALIALDTINYDIPRNDNVIDVTTREKLIEYILSKQLETGGWDNRNTMIDVDITSMVLQALAPYYNNNSDVKTAVNKALKALSDSQNSNGSFSTWGTACSESCAQVITALISLGIDPEKDSRFIKNNISVLDAMMSYSVKSGFSHDNNNKHYDQMATEQCYYALVSYERFMQGKPSLFNMSDLLNFGDVNNDGAINILDCTEIQKYLAEISDFNIQRYIISDFNHDGVVSIIDSTEIQKYIVME